MFYMLKVHVSESMTPQKLSINQLWYSHNITRYSDDFVYTLFRAIYHEKAATDTKFVTSVDDYANIVI